MRPGVGFLPAVIVDGAELAAEGTRAWWRCHMACVLMAGGIKAQTEDDKRSIGRDGLLADALDDADALLDELERPTLTDEEIAERKAVAKALAAINTAPVPVEESGGAPHG